MHTPDVSNIDDADHPPSLLVPFVTGLMVVLTIGGSIGIWSLVAKISSAAIVQATVVAQDGTKSVQSALSGVVSLVATAEGRRVHQGELLYRLDDRTLVLARDSLRHLLAQSRAAELRLQAEQEGGSVFPENARVPDEVSAIAWRQALAEQQLAFKNQSKALSDKIMVLSRDADGSKALARSVERQIIASQAKTVLVNQQLSGAVSLVRSGYASRQHVSEIEQSLADLSIELSGLQAKLSDTSEAAEHDRLEIRQTESSFRETAGSELEQRRIDSINLCLKLRTVEQNMAQLAILAPISGQIVNMSVSSVGAVVNSGSPMLEIVPSSQLVALEAQVPPEDAGGLRIGLPVSVQLPGPVERSMPALTGRLTRISADRLEDPVRGTPYFVVRAELDPASLNSHAESILRPGVSATLMIRKENHSPLAYLVSPLLKFFVMPLH